MTATEIAAAAQHLATTAGIELAVAQQFLYTRAHVVEAVRREYPDLDLGDAAVTAWHQDTSPAQGRPGPRPQPVSVPTLSGVLAGCLPGYTLMPEPETLDVVQDPDDPTRFTFRFDVRALPMPTETGA